MYFAESRKNYLQNEIELTWRMHWELINFQNQVWSDELISEFITEKPSWEQTTANGEASYKMYTNV